MVSRSLEPLSPLLQSLLDGQQFTPGNIVVPLQFWVWVSWWQLSLYMSPFPHLPGIWCKVVWKVIFQSIRSLILIELCAFCKFNLVPPVVAWGLLGEGTDNIQWGSLDLCSLCMDEVLHPFSWKEESCRGRSSEQWCSSPQRVTCWLLCCREGCQR